MRIAFTTSEFVTEKKFDGGLANYLYRCSKALVQRGHTVHVLTISDENNASFDFEGIRVHRVLRRRFSLLETLTFHRVRDIPQRLWTSLLMIRRLRKIHRESGLDVVQHPSYFLYTSFLSSILLPIVPSALRISSLTRFINQHDFEQTSRMTRLLEWLELQQIRRARSVFVPSDKLKDLVQQAARRADLAVIRTPFFAESVKSGWHNDEKELEGMPYALFFGRFSKHKGVHILAEALERFFAACPDAHMVLVGADAGTSEMSNYLRAKSGDYVERLHIFSPKRHASLYPMISEARMVVLPSLIDNMPNACLEAMGLGVSVIGTYGSSIDELLIHEETGFLVEAGCADRLAATMVAVWERPDLARIGEAAARAVEQHAPDIVTEHLVSYYRQIGANDQGLNGATGLGV